MAQPVVEARGMAGAWSCCCLSSAADERHTGAGSEGAQAREDPCLVAGVCKPPTLLDPALRADAASGSDRRVNPETWGPLLSTPYQATKRGLIPEHSPSYLSAGGCWLRVWAPPQMQHPTPPFCQVVKRLPKTRSGKVMRRLLKKIITGKAQDLGDTTTLEDPGVITEILSTYQKHRDKRAAAQ